MVTFPSSRKLFLNRLHFIIIYIFIKKKHNFSIVFYFHKLQLILCTLVSLLLLECLRYWRRSIGCSYAASLPFSCQGRCHIGHCAQLEQQWIADQSRSDTQHRCTGQWYEKTLGQQAFIGKICAGFVNGTGIVRRVRIWLAMIGAFAMATMVGASIAVKGNGGVIVTVATMMM